MRHKKLSKVLAIDPANTKTSFVLFDRNTFEIYDKGRINNNDFIEYLKNVECGVVALEIIVNMGVSGRTLFETAEAVGVYTYIVNDRQIALKRVTRNEVKKHFKVKRSTKAQKQPSADSQIRSRLIERFGQEHTKGLAYDMWQAYAVGVYAVDKEV